MNNCPHCGQSYASYPTPIVGDNPLAYMPNPTVMYGNLANAAAGCNPSMNGNVVIGGNNPTICNTFAGGVAMQGQNNLVFSLNAQQNTK